MTIILMIPLIAVNTTTYVYFGNMLLTLIKLLIISVENRIMKFQTIIRFQRKLIICQSLFTILFVVVYIVFAKAFFLEHLSRFEILYLAFVTFSTVGFGDVEFDPKQMQERKTYGGVLVLQQLLFVGAFAMVASLITAVSEVFSNERNNEKNDLDRGKEQQHDTEQM